MRFRIFSLSLVLLASFVWVGTVEATDYRSPEVKVYAYDDGSTLRAFNAYAAAFKGGGEVAVGDIRDNAAAEIVVGAGRGGGPHVRVFNTAGTWTGYGYFPFHPDYRGGIDVALGDTDGDGEQEIIVGQASDGQAWVKVYEADDAHTIRAEFIAYGESFEGGVHVAAGDIDGDGIDEVITAAGMGSSGHVRAFDGSGNWTGFDLFPFEDGYKGGGDVAVGNIDGGPEEEIVVSKASFGTAQVKVYKTDSSKRVVSDFTVVAESHKEGVNVAMGDVDADGEDEVLVGMGGNGPQVMAYESYGERMDFNTFAYESDFRGGVRVAAGDLDSTHAGDEIVTIPGRRVWLGRPGIYKYVDVNLSEQHLYAYEGGRVAFDFPISSGTAKYPTPPGDYVIQSKNPLQNYRWEYGPEHPDNYDIKDVPWNMQFNGPYFLHGAFWHNNFGTPMSHGCINISIPNAQHIYEWVGVGDKVFIHY